jgi:5'-AMP-activated protein kinase catalytic alpha subunit
VTLAIHKLTGRYVAIKAINKEYMQDSYSRQKVMQEVYILRKIRHSNIIRLYEVFESSKNFLLVMEYASGGDLLQYVKTKKYLEEYEAKKIFR